MPPKFPGAAGPLLGVLHETTLLSLAEIEGRGL